MLEGSLELQVADETHLLEQGDALTYPLSKPHTWRNASDTEIAARALGLGAEPVLANRRSAQTR